MASRYDDELWELRARATRTRRPTARVGRVARARPARARPGLRRRRRVERRSRAERLTLADVSAVALARARARLPDAEAVELEPDAPLPFADGAFDLVVCTETLEHVRDVQLLLSEVRRVLEPGGRLAVTTPAHRRLIARRPDPLSPHLRFLTKRTLRALLEQMGFDVRELDRRDGGLFALAAR